ncbi:MAG: hypothetical protein JWM56_1043 [Candidatus Peribacteria bacterium]|nr:hypothetical protein [Candidatus Peribacteria bacterium]
MLLVFARYLPLYFMETQPEAELPALTAITASYIERGIFERLGWTVECTQNDVAKVLTNGVDAQATNPPEPAIYKINMRNKAV